jgi:hypothetical protein
MISSVIGGRPLGNNPAAPRGYLGFGEVSSHNGAFIWGSFVTAKPAPGDLDILLNMDEDFEADGVTAAAQALFNSVRAKLLFESDVFRARGTRYCGTGATVIQTDDQMLLAQRCIANPRSILQVARKVHSRQDYTRMAQPILLEVQQRAQEILEYLSGDLEQPIAS